MIFKSLKKLFKKVITKSVFAFGIWHTLQLKLANLGFLHSPLRSSLALQFKINFVPSSFHSTSTIKIRLNSGSNWYVGAIELLPLLDLLLDTVLQV
jgi:hypothetical protein